eukprot:scaffold70294_cov30-Tisochrysis_lutea.AAC.4
MGSIRPLDEALHALDLGVQVAQAVALSARLVGSAKDLAVHAKDGGAPRLGEVGRGVEEVARAAAGGGNCAEGELVETLGFTRVNGCTAYGGRLDAVVHQAGSCHT